MKRASVLSVITLVLSLILLPRAFAVSEWVRISPDVGRYVHAIAIDPYNSNTIYIGLQNQGGMLITHDAGNTWHRTLYDNFLDITPLYVNTIQIDPLNPSTVYAGGWADSTLYLRKSTDGGVTWSSLNFHLGEVYDIAISPHTPSTLYLASPHRGISKSEDGGVTWSVIGPWNPWNGEACYVTIITIDPYDPDILYAAPSLNTWGVIKTTDGGITWNEINSGFNPALEYLNFSMGDFAIDPRNPSTVFVGGNSGVWKSSDGGATWNKSSRGLPLSWGNWAIFVSALAIDPQIPDIMYAALRNMGIFKSEDSGMTWNPMEVNGLEGLDSFMSIAIDPSNANVIYAGTSEGLFKYQSINTPPVVDA
jgi:photosystem II stability/assembly factor-like uncharacterized protein